MGGRDEQVEYTGVFRTVKILYDTIFVDATHFIFTEPRRVHSTNRGLSCKPPAAGDDARVSGVLSGTDGPLLWVTWVMERWHICKCRR